jgi:hypothetical protein
MATAPTHLRIRSYNVGFGDCFLLTFTYARGAPRNVLIDFGSTEGSKQHGPARGMLEIAQKIRDDCGGKLQMVVATHRHTDHISGFAGKPGAVIHDLRPDLVVQPWTEDPKLDPKATAGGSGLRARQIVAGLSELQGTAEAALQKAPKLRDETPSLARALTFLGETNIKNRDAVEALMTLGTKRVYASFGTKLAVKALLPGVRIDVLGPPTLDKSKGIMTATPTEQTEFWHLAARVAATSRIEPAEDPIFPDAATATPTSEEARRVIPRIDKMRGENLLAIVRSLDGVLNNTSLILTFEIGDALLVFPGDAQIENWRYALRDAPNAQANRERLKKATFYKVGHHGSLNATPKKLLWNEFERLDAADPADRLHTMVSTLRCKHGTVASDSEVPRGKLVAELEQRSDFHTTEKIDRAGDFWVDVDLDL